jgi:hypothetical protein
MISDHFTSFSHLDFHKRKQQGDIEIVDIKFFPNIRPFDSSISKQSLS